MRALTLLVSFLLFPALADAGISGWAENPGARMRIVVLPPDADGHIRGALEIEPTAGWITYWREPGDAGTPPQITIAPESGLSLDALRFPPPKTFRQNGVRDIGYDGPVALPFTLKGNAKTGTLKASAFIGICKEICIPFQAEFEVPLQGAGSEAEAVVQKAEARLPEAPSADFFASKPRIGADGRTVTVPVRLPEAGDWPAFYLTGPEGYVYLDPSLEQGGKSDTYAIFRVEELPRGYTLSGKTWTLLAVSGQRAMETPLVFD
ncbi:cytochrome C biogenesis protein [Rhizobiaceae bacterium BDR2-2]|uniref:Cytochrome C biogenesis protein n=1 Tax=Ectorhizobium quercum TaxID=2965071 RepID=A0AAE3SVW8_9HYPH|nr:protein-disulfide reductase DsbD domain-containing protein [Ectorhizobium quercum]MCX8996389.1 cytochrome C biogenesis protein [Ectorhizobium quercum]MCX8998572.1 cytochrome C biogenesis protein [Ectorhizobium quercum]